jgi:alpha-1,6-mannosyltransferase
MAYVLSPERDGARPGPPATRQPENSAPTRRRRLALGVGLLVGLGLLLELVLLGLWPLSYDLTQGADFSFEYLLQYRDVWEFFRPILERFEALFPQAATSLELLTALLTLFWLAAFGLYAAAFLLVRRLPRRWWLALPIVVGTVLFQATLCLMPGTFTTDLFSYAMYGFIPRVYDLNPYIYVPGYFPANRLTSWIHPIWYYTPSIYGPLWIDLSVWLTGFTRDRSLVDQALIYRLVSNLAQLLNVGLFALLIRKLQAPRPLSLLLLFAWNPLLLFEFAASGHNDSLMMSFVLLAMLLAAQRVYWLAVLALAAGALIKVTAVLLLPLLAIHWALQHRRLPRRLGVLALAGLISLGLAVLLYLPWYSGPETFLLIDYWSKGPMYLNYVPDLLARAIADQALDPDRLDPTAALETARTGLKWATRVIFVGYYAWELTRVRRVTDLLAASSRVLLIFLLLVNTWVLAWYLTWPFMLAAALGWERLETRLAAAFTFTAPVMMYNHHYWSEHMSPLLWFVYLAPLLLLLPRTGRLLGRGRLPAEPSPARPGQVSTAP